MNKDSMENDTIIQGQDAQKMSQIQNELLFANREIVRGSDFKANLDALNEFLTKVPSPSNSLSHIARARTEEEMHRAIVQETMRAAERNTSDTIDTWTTKTMPMDVRFVSTMLVALTGFTIALGGFLVALALPLIGMVAMLVGGMTMTGGFLANPDGKLYDVQFRNRVLRRKKYKREVRRLLGEAEHLRQRNAALTTMRTRSLEAARTTLESLNADFQLKNPGDKLALASNSNGQEEVKIVRDESYTEADYIAARALNGSAGRKALGQ